MCVILIINKRHTCYLFSLLFSEKEEEEEAAKEEEVVTDCTTPTFNNLESGIQLKLDFRNSLLSTSSSALPKWSTGDLRGNTTQIRFTKRKINLDKLAKVDEAKCSSR